MYERVVSLDTLAGGALREMFGEELDTVLANIADPNTDDTAKRSITMTVTFKPNKKRDEVEVLIGCSAKLASVMKHSTRLFVGRQQGRLIAVEDDPRQSGLFDDPNAKPAPLAAVANFPSGGTQES